jgi:hypothetical protein
MLPEGSLTQAYLYMAIHVASIVALTVGMRINRPSRPAVWNVLLVGQGFYFCGHMLWYFLPVLRETTLPFPSWSDPFFIVAYLSIAVGLIVLIRSRSHAHNRADLVDAAIIALGVTIAFWVFQVQRTFDLSGLTMTAKAGPGVGARHRGHPASAASAASFASVFALRCAIRARRFSRYGDCLSPTTLPSAFLTLATSRPRPTSCGASSSVAPAASSDCTLAAMSSTSQ